MTDTCSLCQTPGPVVLCLDARCPGDAPREAATPQDLRVHMTYIPGDTITSCGVRCNPYHPEGALIRVSTPDKEGTPTCSECLLIMLPVMRHNCTNHAVLRSALAARDGSDCYICGCPLYINQPLASGDKAPGHKGMVLIDGVAYKHCTIDHYMPKAHGGLDTSDNLRLSCGPCNSRKGEKIPEDVLTVCTPVSTLDS